MVLAELIHSLLFRRLKSKDALGIFLINSFRKSFFYNYQQSVVHLVLMSVKICFYTMRVALLVV